MINSTSLNEAHYLRLTPATAMGHMNQRRQNTRSTKPKLIAQDDDDINPLGSEEKTHLVFAVILDHGQVYTDLTGAFPTQSSRGNNGLIICYSYDANYIRPITMKSKSGAEWVRAFGVVFEEMTAKGFKPKLQTMDNEVSAALKKYFTEKEMSYQLVPPTVTVPMRMIELSERSRNILKQALPQSIPTSRRTCGIDFCPTQKSL
jgi:hypothetical protein